MGKMNHYKLIQKTLNDQASEAHHVGFIIEEVAKRMTDRLNYIKLEPKQILDIGYGLGIDYKLLTDTYPDANIYALDLAINMLKQHSKISTSQSMMSKLFNKLQRYIQLIPNKLSRLLNDKKAVIASTARQFSSDIIEENKHSVMGKNKLAICANAINLPIASQSIDLVWSDLTLPYINIDDFKNYFSEINRVLKLGGTFLLSGLGVDSLRQLRQLGLSTYNFPDMHLIGDILVEVGFTNPVTDIDIIKLEYYNLSQLLADIRCIGGGRMLEKYLTKTTPNYLFSEDDEQSFSGAKTTSTTLEDKYKELEANFWQMTKDGKFPLTLEVFYAHAWKDRIRKDLVSGRSVISFYPN